MRYFKYQEHQRCEQQGTKQKLKSKSSSFHDFNDEEVGTARPVDATPTQLPELNEAKAAVG
jgi:hypothetical protein